MKPKKQSFPYKKRTVNDSALARSATRCRDMVERFNELKAKLLEQFRGDLDFTRCDRLIRHAVGEAEALAWLTPFPHLFLPVLAEEKVETVRAWRGRQQQLLACGQQQRLLLLANQPQ